MFRGALARSMCRHTRCAVAKPNHIDTGVMSIIERLPPGDGLCHADLHAGNVIITANGPRIVDWLGAVCAGGALDLASCHIVLTELVPAGVDDPERPRAVNAAVQREYAQLAGMSGAALTAAIEPYLSIVRVFVLWGLAQVESLPPSAPEGAGGAL